MNANRQVRIEKITLNIGAGKHPGMLEKGFKLLESLTDKKPIKTTTMKRIASWGLRPRLPIGAKVTMRGEDAKTMLKRLIAAKDNVLSEKMIDTQANMSFGIAECIDIPDTKYDPDIGIIGLEVAVTFERPGYRIKKRRLLTRKVPTKQKVTKEEVIDLLKAEFGVSFGEEEA
ncbi:MAG: 50S ribosomal protein L5 [archaeon]